MDGGLMRRADSCKTNSAGLMRHRVRRSWRE
jgi:hypothetical protein